MKLFPQSFSSLPLIYSRRVVVSYKRKYVHELLVNRRAMTVAVDLGRKATKQTNKQTNSVVGERVGQVTWTNK